MKKLIAAIKCLFGYHASSMAKLTLGDGIEVPKHVYYKKYICPLCGREKKN